MTEAEKIILSLIKLLKNNDPVLIPIAEKLPEIDRELAKISENEDAAEVIQNYCKPNPQLKNVMINMTKNRANFEEFYSQYTPKNKPSETAEKTENTSLIPELREGIKQYDKNIENPSNPTSSEKLNPQSKENQTE